MKTNVVVEMMFQDYQDDRKDIDFIDSLWEKITDSETVVHYDFTEEEPKGSGKRHSVGFFKQLTDRILSGEIITDPEKLKSIERANKPSEQETNLEYEKIEEEMRKKIIMEDSIKFWETPQDENIDKDRRDFFDMYFVTGDGEVTAQFLELKKIGVPFHVLILAAKCNVSPQELKALVEITKDQCQHTDLDISQMLQNAITISSKFKTTQNGNDKD